MGYAHGAVARVEGYASRFGERDLNGDIVERGAFARAVRPGRTLPMLFQHMAETPVGRWRRLLEDAHGLFVSGDIFLDTVKGSEVWALLAGGAIDGLSIGYRTVRAQRSRGNSVRRLIELDLWEVSVVTFPMAPGARVTRVGGPETADGTRLFAEAVRGAARTLAR